MICFEGRGLTVLATPPHKLGAEGGTRTRGLDLGNVASWPLDDFRLERAARGELASSGWKPEAPAAIPCSQWREMKDSNHSFSVQSAAFLPLDEEGISKLAKSSIDKGTHSARYRDIDPMLHQIYRCTGSA